MNTITGCSVFQIAFSRHNDNLLSVIEKERQRISPPAEFFVDQLSDFNINEPNLDYSNCKDVSEALRITVITLS